MIFDAHTDILSKCKKELINGNENYFKNTHLNNLMKGTFCGGIYVVFTDVDTRDKTSFLWNEIDVAFKILNKIEKETGMVIAKNNIEIQEAIANGKYFIILGLEGLSGIGNDVNQIETLYRLGFRHASLTWNERNLLASGTSDKTLQYGLTDTGREVIRKMDELGMIIDVSHLNEKSFWDVVEVMKGPIIASHSNSRTLCDHARNLSDEQAIAIAKSGGVIGINVCEEFVGETVEEQTLEKLIDHMDYFKQLIGVDYICCGFDFCGYLELVEQKEALKGLSWLNESWKIPKELRVRGYTKEEVDKISYKNLLRVVETIL